MVTKWFKEWIWGSAVTILVIGIIPAAIWLPSGAAFLLLVLAIGLVLLKWERSSRPSLSPADKLVPAKKRSARKTRARKR